MDTLFPLEYMIVIDSETGEYEKNDVPGKMGYRVYTAPADDIT